MKRGAEGHDPRAGVPPAEEAITAPALQNVGGEAPPGDRPEAPAPAALEPEAAADTGADFDALKDRWLRAEADLQNYRRRAAREQGEARRSAEDALLRDWIGVLDDLDRALESAGAAGVSESWLAGLKLVAQRMLDLMARHGVRPLDPAGQPFDPEVHEALAEVPGPEGMPPGTVVQVVQKGYAREGRALRPARVLVARGTVAAEPR